MDMMPPNTTTSFQHRDDEALSWLMNFYLVITAFIIILGLVGNSFTIIVLRREPFRSTSYGFHLTALAVADNLGLILYTFTKESTRYLFGKDIFGESDIMCKIFLHSRTSVKLFASFNTGFICIERFIAVWFPFQSKILLSKRAAIIVNSCILAAANIAGIVHFLVSIVKSGKCLAFEKTAGAIPVPVVLLYMVNVLSIMPTVILLTFTPLIIVKLISQQRQRRRMTNDIESGNGQLAYMTAMLIGTVIAYLLLVSFPTLARILLPTIGISRGIARKYGIHDLTTTAEHLNCSVNFVIYGLLCIQFRKQFINVCIGSCKMKT